MPIGPCPMNPGGGPMPGIGGLMPPIMPGIIPPPGTMGRLLKLGIMMGGTKAGGIMPRGEKAGMNGELGMDENSYLEA